MNNPYFKRMFSFMKPFMLLYIIGIILYSSQGFLSSLISSLFISRLTASVLDKDINGIIYAVLFFLAMMAVYFPLLAADVVFYNNSEMKAIRVLKQQLFRRFVNKGLEASLSSSAGEGIAAMNTDADTAAHLYGNTLAPVLSCVISVVFSALVVFLVDYRLGLASIGIGLCAFLIQLKFAKPLGHIGEETLTANAASVRSFSEILTGAVAIRALNAQQRALLRFDRDNHQLKILSFRKAFITMWQDLFTTLQGWLTLTGVFTLGGYLVATGRLSFPALMMVPAMCETIASGMSGIGGAWAAMQAPLAAAKRVTLLLDGDGAGTQNDIPPVTNTVFASPETAFTGYALTLSDLRFRYSTGTEDALSGINLHINENELVAFVGESGSGKSTLLKIIAGLYIRDDYHLQLGGSICTQKDIAAWRSHFAYVDQSCKLFDMSIAENIALGAGMTVEAAGMDAIKAAAAAARADEFISRLPQGYDTACGEKGASLSGGQKQRIAIARALMKQSPVLIFDEATSALDAESERLVMETINSLRGSHTVLMATHHLNNIVSADKIIVMDKGRVAETGRHTELSQQDGIYNRLYTRGRQHISGSETD